MSFYDQVQVKFWGLFYREWYRFVRWFKKFRSNPLQGLELTSHPMWDTTYIIHPKELLSNTIGFEDIKAGLLDLQRQRDYLIAWSTYLLGDY